MKDLVCKETVVACRRKSEKLRFDIKRVVDDRGKITKLTFDALSLRHSEFPKSAALETSAS